MAGPQMLILGDRRRGGPGRPKSSETLSHISTRVTTRDHDRLVKMAEDQGVSVSAMLRRVVERTTTRR